MISFFGNFTSALTSDCCEARQGKATIKIITFYSLFAFFSLLSLVIFVIPLCIHGRLGSSKGISMRNGNKKHEKPERYNMIKQRNMNSIRNSIVIIFEIISFIEWNGTKMKKNENPREIPKAQEGKEVKCRPKLSVKRMKKKNWKNALLSPLCDRSYGTGSFML